MLFYLFLHSCTLLLVGSQLFLPFFNISSTLLQCCSQTCVVVLQCLKLYLPLLGIGGTVKLTVTVLNLADFKQKLFYTLIMVYATYASAKFQPLSECYFEPVVFVFELSLSLVGWKTGCRARITGTVSFILNGIRLKYFKTISSRFVTKLKWLVAV